MSPRETTVHACPVCGTELERTCYHEGEDLEATDMLATRAAELREGYAETMLDDFNVRDLPSERLADLITEAEQELRKRERDGHA
jgi:hypothetical protein